MDKALVRKNQSSLFDKLRLYNLICFVIFLMMRRVAPLEFLTDNQIIPGLLAIFSFILLFWDLLTKRRLFQGKYVLILITFLVLCSISIILNKDMGMASGVVLLSYYAIEFFFIYSIECMGDPIQRKRELVNINRVFIVIQLVYGLIAIGMFLFSIQFTYVKNGILIEQGYQPQYGRAWGIYYEANFLGISSLISMILSFINLRHARNKVSIGLYIVNILIQFFVLVLSGSRSTILAFLAAAFIAGWYYSFKYVRENYSAIKKQLIRIITGIICSALCYMSILLIANIAPRFQAVTLNDTKVRTDIMSIVKEVYEYNGFTVTLKEDRTIEDVLSREDLVEKQDISNGRLPMWIDGIKIFSHKPIFGVSMRNAGNYAKEYGLSTNEDLLNGGSLLNGYLEVLVGMGFMGFAMLLTYLLLCAMRFYKYQRKSYPSRSEIGVSLMIVTALMVFVIFLSDVFSNFTIYSLLFWIYLGYGMLLIGHDENNAREYCKAAFTCDTSYQILNAINFVVNDMEGSANCSDIYIYHQFTNSQAVAQRIRDLQIFRKVYDVKPYKNNKAIYTKLRTLTRLLTPKRVLRTHLWNKDDFCYMRYEYLGMFFFTQFTLSLRQINPDSQVLLLEDGTGSYFGNLEKDYRSGLLDFFNRFFMNGELDYHPQRLYVNNPELCRSTVAEDIRLLPRLDAQNPALSILENVFDYHDNRAYADKRIIYLTQPLNEVAGYKAGMHGAMVALLAEYAPEVLLRVHPRQKNIDTGILALDGMNNLWELECVHSIKDGHVLLGAFSTAQFAPKLICDSEPYLIFCYKTFFNNLDTEFWKDTVALIDRFRALYRQPEKIYVPDNMEELHAILSRLSKGY